MFCDKNYSKLKWSSVLLLSFFFLSLFWSRSIDNNQFYLKRWAIRWLCDSSLLVLRDNTIKMGKWENGFWHLISFWFAEFLLIVIVLCFYLKINVSVHWLTIPYMNIYDAICSLSLCLYMLLFKPFDEWEMHIRKATKTILQQQKSQEK